MIILSIWLYGKPSWDIPIEGKNFLDPKMIKEHNEYLYSHLNCITDIIEKLNSNGSDLGIPYDKIVLEEIR